MVNYIKPNEDEDSENEQNTDYQSETADHEPDTAGLQSDHTSYQSDTANLQSNTAELNRQGICTPDLKHKIITNIIGIEGDYSNHKDDGGGETRYGITKQKALEYGYVGSMRDLPYQKAYDIIEKDFYDTLKIADIAKISSLIAEEIADTAVNTGQKPAIQFLQKALNSLNNRSKHYPDISIDGVVGRKTIETLQKYFDQRKDEQGEEVLLVLLNMFQTIHYWNESTETVDDKHESFLFGWLRNRVLNKFKIIS
jgi:hypothetical protein